jgi:hypothetical protein
MAAKTLLPPFYRRICAWCKVDMGEAPKGSTADTHGICPTCAKNLK